MIFLFCVYDVFLRCQNRKESKHDGIIYSGGPGFFPCTERLSGETKYIEEDRKLSKYFHLTKAQWDHA